jgi:PAS domain S-box-containing protein
MIYHAAVDTQRVFADAREKSAGLIRIVTEGHKDLIDDAHVMLKLLSTLPIELLAPSRCADLSKAYSATYSQFDNMKVLNAAGDIVCAVAPPPIGTNFADRQWFQTALKTRRFTISEVLISKISGSPSVIFALPVLDKGGKVIAIVAIALLAQRFDQLMDLAKLPAGSTVTVLNRNGTIIRRQPDPEIWVGKKYPLLDKFKSGAAKDGSYLRAREVDDIDRLYNFASLYTSDGEEAWLLAIGSPEHEIFRPVYQNVQRHLLWIVVIAIFALTTAWVGTDKLLVQRLRRLVDVSTTLSNGNLNSRSGMTNQRDEIGQLASAFDKMAEALEARELERKNSEETHARLAAIVESTNDAIIGRNLDDIATTWNRGAENLFGYSKEEMIGQAPLVNMHADDIGLVMRNLRNVKRGGVVKCQESVRIRKDGKPVHVSITLSPVIDASGAIIGTSVIARDIGDRVRAVAELKALHVLNLAVTSKLDVSFTLDSLLEQIAIVFPYANSHIKLFNKTTGKLEPIACRFNENIDEARWKLETREGGGDSIQKSISETKKPLIIRDMRTDERTTPQGFWVSRGMTSYLGVPMIVDGDVIGVFSLITKEEHNFDETEVGFVEVATSQASIAIQNSQLYETTKTQLQELANNRKRIHSLMIAQLRARDEEAKRIAGELHDESSQLLAAMRLALDDLEKRPIAGVIERVQPIKEMLGQVEERLRNLSHQLHPAILDQWGLSASLDFLAEQVAQRSGILVRVDVVMNGRLSRELELSLYRVAQEALTNVTRHSQAKYVEVQLCDRKGRVYCQIKDDGIGFEPKTVLSGQSRNGGLGLALARERIEAQGGTLELDSAPGKGTRLQITIPKEKNFVDPVTAS